MYKRQGLVQGIAGNALSGGGADYRHATHVLPDLSLIHILVDGREKTDLYTAYDKTIKELELPLLKTFIPDTKR